MIKKLILGLLLLSSLVVAEEIKLSNFSIAYNTTDGSCYPMNDVDAFYVFKLVKKGDIKINNIHHRNVGDIVIATETYKTHTVNYIFYSNIETCKKFKDKL